MPSNIGNPSQTLVTPRLNETQNARASNREVSTRAESQATKAAKTANIPLDSLMEGLLEDFQSLSNSSSSGRMLQHVDQLHDLRQMLDAATTVLEQSVELLDDIRGEFEFAHMASEGERSVAEGNISRLGRDIFALVHHNDKDSLPILSLAGYEMKIESNGPNETAIMIRGFELAPIAPSKSGLLPDLSVFSPQGELSLEALGLPNGDFSLVSDEDILMTVLEMVDLAIERTSGYRGRIETYINRMDIRLQIDVDTTPDIRANSEESASLLSLSTRQDLANSNTGLGGRNMNAIFELIHRG